tara:strand:- start:801 stop:1412 length:612 start_codon:yes stop_codon:yes gene_type:complete
MAKKFIALLGDSFAAEYNADTPGWVDILAEHHSVNNVAEAGVGEYKILRQLRDIQGTNPNWKSLYQCVIVAHTSPFRVHTPKHPLHQKGLHKNCDLIYNDLKNRFDWFNESLSTAKNWFVHHFDDDYQIGTYKLVREEIKRIIGDVPYLSIDHFGLSANLATETNKLDFSDFWLLNRGNVNHYTAEGNQIVAKAVIDKIEQIC